MTEHDIRSRLLGVTALASEYCMAVENAAETDRNEFIASMLQLLPKLYLEFNDITPASKHSCSCGHDHDCDHDCDHDHDCDCDDEHSCGCGHHHHDEEEIDEFAPVSLEEEDDRYYGEYVDEDYYESLRRHIESMLGPDDVYLETFEEDMKYSDTPIGASIAESLADIFQPLYNFISLVKDTDGEELEGAYRVCHDNFVAYWSQTLCNVLRALNHLYYSTI